MSKNYNGNPGNGFRVAAVNIASSTNASPIVVTTSAPHGLLEGDRVLVVGHATNTAANGTWFAHIVDGAHVALYGGWTPGTGVTSASTGNGVGGATGTTKFLGLMPRVLLPDDASELVTVEPVNVPAEDAKDVGAWLAERVGAYRLVDDDVVGNIPNATPFALWAPAYQAAHGSWGALDNLLALESVTPYDVQPGDVIAAELVTSGQATGTVGTDDVALRLGIACYDYGASAPSTADITIGGGGAILYGFAEGSATHLAPVHVVGRWSPSLTHGKQLTLFTMAYGKSASSFFSLAGDWLLRVRIWRSNA